MTTTEPKAVDVFDPARYEGGTRVRASSLPRIMACPASLKAPDILIDNSDETAALGAAVHAVLADVIAQDMAILPQLAPYARRYEVEQDDLRFLAFRGMDVWSRFKTALDCRTVRVEQEYVTPFTDGYELSGHVDVVGKTANSPEETLVIIDWKTGFIERDYNAQLLAYAYLAFRNTPCPDPAADSNGEYPIKIVTAWLRSGSWDVLELTLADVLDFADRLRKLLAEDGAVYHPSIATCQYCPRAVECPARAQVVQSAIRNMWPPEHGIALDDRQKLAGLYDQVQALKRVIGEYDDALRTVVQQSGPLGLPDGRKLIIQEQARDSIHFNQVGADLLQRHFGLADMGELFQKLGVGTVTIAKKRLLDAVMADAPRGQKAATKDMVMADLNNAGCVSTTRFPKLAAVKMLPENTEGK